MDKKPEITICYPTNDDGLAENLETHVDHTEAFFRGEPFKPDQDQALAGELKMDKKTEMIICEPIDDDEFYENLCIPVDCAESDYISRN